MSMVVPESYSVAGHKGARRARGIILHLLVIIYFTFAVFPFIWILGMSLKAPLDVISDPPKIIFEPTLDNYAAVLGQVRSERGVSARTDIPRTFRNSVIISSIAVFIAMVFGNLAAFTMAKMRVPGKDWIAFFFLSFRFAPALAFIIPTFVVYRQIGLYNTHLGLVMMYQLIAVPLIVWTMRSYYEGIPNELFEAARIDGAGTWELLRRVAMPLAAPGIASTAILAFIGCWNNFTYPLLLGARETQTVTVATVTFIGYEEVLWGQMSAAAVITMVPELILALLVMQYIVRGLTYGAVKE
jgi:multiple sugar transport system permease protein